MYSKMNDKTDPDEPEVHKNEQQASQDLEIAEPQPDLYSTIFWNKPPSVMTARMVLYVIFFIVGGVQGYQYAIILEL